VTEKQSKVTLTSSAGTPSHNKKNSDEVPTVKRTLVPVSYKTRSLGRADLNITQAVNPPPEGGSLRVRSFVGKKQGSFRSKSYKQLVAERQAEREAKGETNDGEEFTDEVIIREGPSRSQFESQDD